MKGTLLLLTATAALASEHVFSVHDDVLAYPQFEVVYSESYITEEEANTRLHDQFQKSEESYQASISDVATHDGQANRPNYASDSFDDTSSIYEHMIFAGNPYLCLIPIIQSGSTNDTSESLSEADQQKELARATDRGWELLQDLEGKCMYFVSGWWSYSFCYNTQIKQFHQLPPGNGAPIYPPQEDQTTPAYVLGQYGDKAKDSNGRLGDVKRSETSELQTKGETRYLVQKLGGGTTCDLTGKDRKVEVQFHCHPQSTDRIGFIKEVTTCTYLMVVYTPRLCNDVAFLPPRENQAHTISCQEVLASDQASEWESRKNAEATRKFLDVKPGSRKFAGNIEIGGKKLVGEDGRRIEKGKVVTPPEERADIVARKEGGEVRQLSKEDMKKLDLDPDKVEAFRKELQEIAGNKDWKLEVIDEVNGDRQIRGIVESETIPKDTTDEEDTDADDKEGSEEVYKEDL